MLRYLEAMETSIAAPQDSAFSPTVRGSRVMLRRLLAGPIGFFARGQVRDVVEVRGLRDRLSRCAFNETEATAAVFEQVLADDLIEVRWNSSGPMY